MILQFLILCLSLAALLKSSDFFVDSVVVLAKRLGVSTLVIGLTVVAIGTSLPEVAASAMAAIRAHPEIALGNVIGSNICNVAIVLALASVVRPITCNRSVVLREGALMIFLSGVLWALAIFYGGISRTVAIVFLLVFFTFVSLVFWQSSGAAGGGEDDEDPLEAVDMKMLAIKVLGSLIVLLISSEFLVQSTVSLARVAGVSEGVIALTMIALGTSLPELSVAVSAARMREGDLLVGNILGSNISNILLVLGTAATIYPFEISDKLVKFFDIPAMITFAILMVFFLFRTPGVTRDKGIALLLLYCVVLWRCFAFSA